jgi:GNAT superfamily N-acetyltransferase
MEAELVRPNTPAQWRVARGLVEEYAEQLGIDLTFQDFEREINAMPHEYGPPDGCFVLAQVDGACVGCGGVRRFDARTCEMKRLYVTAAARGGRVGRAIAEALVAFARARGYEAMLLDTLPTMTAAHALYASLGFVRTDAYRFNPVAGTTFWRLPLASV